MSLLVSFCVLAQCMSCGWVGCAGRSTVRLLL